MRNLFLIFSMDIFESLRSRWFLIYSLVFGGLIALFFISGVIDSRVMGFSGLSRLLLIFIEICIVILPIFILITTVRTIAADRESNVLEYLLSFPISLGSYYFGRFFGRLLTVTIPIFGAMLLALIWGALKGVDTPWDIFLYYIALIFALNLNFLGFSFFISSLVKTQEIALGAAFFLWLLLLAFIDVILIGMMMKNLATPEAVFGVALANPLQVFRVGAIALFDPELSVIGPAAYFILDEFGKLFFSIYAVLYPAFLGALFALFGFLIFRKRDLV